LKWQILSISGIVVESMGTLPHPDSPERKITYWFADLALIFLGVVTVFAKSYEHLLKAIDSSIYASLSMSATGQGLIPHLPIGLEANGGFYGTHGFNDHPTLLLYLSGWLMRLLGPEAWTARLLPCLLSAGCVWVLFVLGTHWGSRFRGWIAGGVLALTVSYFRNASGFQLDAPMTFFILLSFLAWEKKWPIRTGVFAGLAIIMKAPVGLLIFPVALLAEGLAAYQAGKTWRLGRTFWATWISALSICLFLVVLFWTICGMIGGIGIVTDYWGRYVFGTLQGRDGTQSFDPFLFFRDLGRFYWPWLPLFLSGAFSVLRRGTWRERGEFIPLSAAIIVTVIVSMIKFKSGAHYFLPAYPFMAWIVAKPISDWLASRELPFLRGAATVIFVACLAIICFPISFTPEALPALRKFNAFIQSEGTANDRVLYVNGGFPYGSFMDYIPEVNFYTGRQLDVKDCGEVNAALAADPRVKWVIVAGENLGKCLSTESRTAFPTAYRHGKVYLLSKHARESEIDLTPLEREGKAATDGIAAPIARGIYQ
jgi:4-amino-4-deoxy-L-arabinose transferase-like glycosyltransferase